LHWPVAAAKTKLPMWQQLSQVAAAADATWASNHSKSYNCSSATATNQAAAAAKATRAINHSKSYNSSHNYKPSRNRSHKARATTPAKATATSQVSAAAAAARQEL